MQSLNTLFGEVGASICVDVLKYNPLNRRAVLRCPSASYVKLRNMPNKYQQGKDTIIFVTKEDHSTPSTVTLPQAEPPPGLILADGSINWSCPCLGGMATGPCGVEFREAFSCFHYSEAEPKGSDCYEAFKTMQECMAKYPTLYNKDEDNEDELEIQIDHEEKQESNESTEAAVSSVASSSASPS
ncbi:Mitochondrial intermembrane space import and assembly protein 40-B [Periplaneta americana]|uniref:Mitochondrial intermembrane space import and assembly protein 40-B n=1 Tax=Periplaneta americana TaxID=6978 RepID=A0ABQ8U2V5_PERAM|nr:Mitochondrial intermembrane space import and assembly protein 40-B [Periplaneta americana]